MKNPHYAAPAEGGEQRDEIQDLADKVSEYLKAGASVEDVPERKLRLLDSRLDDDDTWAQVKQRVESGAGAAVASPSEEETQRRRPRR